MEKKEIIKTFENLPLGTIIKRKELPDKYMIIGRNYAHKNKLTGKVKVKEYVICEYPKGMDLNDLTFLPKQHIDKVIFRGFSEHEGDSNVK